MPPVLSLRCVWRKQSHGTFGPASNEEEEEEEEACAVCSGLEKRLPLIFVQRTKLHRLSGTIWKMCFHSAYSKYNCSLFFLALFQKPSPNFRKMGFCASCHGDGSAEGQLGAEFTSEFLIRDTHTVHNYTQRQLCKKENKRRWKEERSFWNERINRRSSTLSQLDFYHQT